MQLSAIAATSSARFPAYFFRKPNTQLQLLRRDVPLKCTVRNQTSASGSSESTGSAVSECHESIRRDQECPVGSGKPRSWIHFVGVGGCGLSALAMLAIKQGCDVSGSDIAWSDYMDRLCETGARLFVGHSQSNVQRNNGSKFPDAVVVSSAIPEDNLEILFAKSVGVPVYKRGYWLGKLTDQYRLIAVSGSHGKSTTASMLAYVLKEMGDDLTAVVGAHVPQFPEGNIICGGGQDFVLEADEYDGCFLGLSPYIAVVTNLDWEHVDIFKDEEAVRNIFRKFLKQIRPGGHLIICGDSPGAYSLLDQIEGATGWDHSSSLVSTANYMVTTYGISGINEWYASSVCPNTHGGSNYTLCHKGHPLAEISLQIPGVHNILNSLAVIATVITLGWDKKTTYETICGVKLQLNKFMGVSRRLEMIGQILGCHIYDDYAHHPTEVYAAIHAVRLMFPFKALLVIFQPHRYSRLAALKDELAIALSEADQVVVTGVYAARETNVWSISGRDLASSIIGTPADYIASLEELVDKLVLQICREPHREVVVLTVGAGDITMVGPKLLHGVQKRLFK